MHQAQAKRILSLIVLITAAGYAWPQPVTDEPMPARAFKRIGTTKLRHGSRILCLAYSPAGDMLAAGGGNDPLRLWNPKTGALVREFNEPWVHAMTFTNSGETLVYGGYQKTVRLWNFKLNKGAGQETGKLEGHKAAIKAIAVAPDVTLIASGSQDGAIYLWDWSTKRKIAELAGHVDEVTALVYTPDANLLISAGSERLIHFWNTETNQVARTLDAGCGVLALAVSADSKTLFSAGDDNLIRRWDIATGKLTGVFKGHEGIVVSLILRDKTLISGSLDKTVRFWDPKTTEQVGMLPRSQDQCDALAVTKAGDLLATAGTSGAIRIFDVRFGKEVSPAKGPTSALTAMQVSPDNKRLTAVTSTGRILVWDADNSTLVKEWDSQQPGDLVLAYAPDGKSIATASTSVRLWNPLTGAEIAQLPLKAGDAVMALAFAPDSSAIAVARRSGQIDVWDWRSKKEPRMLTYVGALHALAWSGDGKRLAAGGGAKIVIWDASTGNVSRSFDVKEGPPPPFPMVATLAFDADGRNLAAGCFDAMIRIYQLHEKNPTSERGHHLCDGHLSLPQALAFSPDGRTLVSGSYDRTVRLWEAFSGKQIAQFKGHIGPVAGVGFAADGRSVWSAGAEASILQWDVPGLSGSGKLPDLVLTPLELTDSWNKLALEETAIGHNTLWRSVAFAKQSIRHMTPSVHVEDPERIKKLFKDLDSPHYATRLGAMKELQGKGRWMEGRYDAAIANPPSLEYKRRVETLKEKISGAGSLSLAQERLRMRRFMLICEQAGGEDALAALQKIADRGPEEELREEAKGSLKRLKKR